MEGDSNPAWNLNLDGKTIFQILLSSWWWWYFLIPTWNITRSSYPHSHWEYHQGVYGTSGKPNKITRSYHINSSSRNYILLTVLIIIDWFLTKMYGEVDIKLGKDWRDLRIVKELSAQVIDSDGHTRGGRSYKSLQQCSAFPAYLISLCVSMSGQVLDISIIGLTIGGLVHMVPPLSLHTQPYRHLCIHEVEQGWGGLWLAALCDNPFLSGGLLLDMAFHNLHPRNSSHSYNSSINLLMDWLFIHLSPNFCLVAGFECVY